MTCEYTIVVVGEKGERVKEIHCNGTDCLRKQIWNNDGGLPVVVRSHLSLLPKEKPTDAFVEGKCVRNIT